MPEPRDAGQPNRPHPRVRRTLLAGPVVVALVGASLVPGTPGAPGMSGAAASLPDTPAVMVNKITGAGSVSATDLAWQVNGTDLGIMWDNGAGQILAAFGDTFGAGFTRPFPSGGDWRSNVLLRSSDLDLAHGIAFDSAAEDSPGHAKELIPSQKVDGVEITVIPTAGVSVGSRQYLGYMSVRTWGPPGLWDTNYASIAYSDDNGQTWVTAGGPVWDNPSGDNTFQQAAFVRDGGYVYLFGTPNGRFGNAYLARVSEGSVLTKSAYEYWTGTGWATGPDTAAAPIVPTPVAELSVQYHPDSGRWLMMYLAEAGIVLRSAPTPQGPWSAATLVVGNQDYPGLYGGYLHPWSSGPEVYFAMSQWEPYNVYLMRVSVDNGANVANPNLVQDPSFERQPAEQVSSPWSVNGNGGVDDDHWSYSGSRNAYVRYNSGWHDVHQPVAVEPHTAYQLTGWLRTSPNNDNGFIGVRDPATGVPIAEVNFQAVGEWTRFTVPFHSGARTEVVAFTGIWTDNGDMWVQLDDYAIVKAP